MGQPLPFQSTPAGLSLASRPTTSWRSWGLQPGVAGKGRLLLSGVAAKKPPPAAPHSPGAAPSRGRQRVLPAGPLQLPRLRGASTAQTARRSPPQPRIAQAPACGERGQAGSRGRRCRLHVTGLRLLRALLPSGGARRPRLVRRMRREPFAQPWAQQLAHPLHLAAAARFRVEGGTSCGNSYRLGP